MIVLSSERKTEENMYIVQQRIRIAAEQKRKLTALRLIPVLFENRSIGLVRKDEKSHAAANGKTGFNKCFTKSHIAIKAEMM